MRLGLVGVIALIVAWLFAQTYMKGYAAAERRYLEQMDRALAAQLKRERRLQALDMASVLRLAEEEAGIGDEISRIVRPESGLCTDDGVRAYNQSVRAASGNSGPTDTTTASDERG